MMQHEATAQFDANRIDPIEAEVIQHGLTAIPDQIETNITRTAYSPLVYELKDYAVGIVDAEGRLISQAAGGIPLFIADALGTAVRDGLHVHGREGILPGDVLLCNHAATIGQHLNNVAMYTPVFIGPDESELVGFIAIIVHWLDIGGKEVGSCPPTGTTEIFQEGFQLRSVKLWSEGKRCRDIYSIIECNTRFPKMLLGDIEAQLAGCLMGRDLLQQLVKRYSLEKVRAAIQLRWNRSEAAARAAIREIPDGTYRASSLLDNDGYDFDTPIPINVIVRVEGDEMTVDYSEVAPQVPGSINSGRFGGAITAARVAFKYLAAPNEAVNDGSFRPLKVVIPDGKFLSASPNAAMAMYSSPLSTVVDTILKAMVDVVPERVPAGHHGSMSILTIDGVDPKSGERFYNMGGSSGGWGATTDRDGSGPYRTMTHGDTHDVPAEVQEALYPLRILKQEIAPDTGGAGQFRGSWGVARELEMLVPCAVQLNFERRRCPPWGVRGGKDASPPQVEIRRNDGSVLDAPKGNFTIEAGERLFLRAAGGGGFGDPLLRSTDAVARDVRAGVVSVNAAREVYGVAVDEAGNVDSSATANMRESVLK